MSTYNVTAKRWAQGWELHIEGEGVTQVRTLNHADAQVRNYLATMHDRDFDDAEVHVTPELGQLTERVVAARENTKAAEKAQRDAAAEARQVARALRESGLSVTDTAEVLGVSRGRVSQLVNG